MLSDICDTFFARWSTSSWVASRSLAGFAKNWAMLLMSLLAVSWQLPVLALPALESTWLSSWIWLDATIPVFIDSKPLRLLWPAVAIRLAKVFRWDCINWLFSGFCLIVEVLLRKAARFSMISLEEGWSEVCNSTLIGFEIPYIPSTSLLLVAWIWNPPKPPSTGYFNGLSSPVGLSPPETTESCLIWLSSS